MSQKVEHWLFVELIGCSIHNNRGVDKVFGPIWTALKFNLNAKDHNLLTLLIQSQVPVRPANGPSLHNSNYVSGISLTTNPRAHVRSVVESFVAVACLKLTKLRTLNDHKPQ